MAAYAYLFRSTTGEQESELQIRSLIKTKTPKVATHKYESRSDGHFRRLFAVIREYLDALDRGVFNYRPVLELRQLRFPRHALSTVERLEEASVVRRGLQNYRRVRRCRA